MTRSAWLAFAYAVMLGAAGPLTACASSNAADAQETQQQQAQTTQPAQPQTGQTSGYSDAQVRSFVAVRDAIQELTPGQTTEQQAANQQRIAEILAQNNLTADQYNAMAAASRTDQALANRIAAISVGTSFTDAQLRAFVQASTEIDPINRSLATATPEQRTQAGQQIRDILARHNLDAETYNGIAARAQSDQNLAQRIAQMQLEAQGAGDPQ